ncbi:MAG: outer membrane protein transport protein [Alphaproteobacteria bacterium]|nr:outer membrane protein transport protein [Alphaproteobacteria bacterium]
MMRRSIAAGVSTLALLTAAAGPAAASGFQLFEQSVTGLGRAYAGEGAAVEDASTVFSNPAGMPFLGLGKSPTTLHATAGLHAIVPKAKFKDTGSTFAVGGGNMNPRGVTSDGGEYATVPNLYVAGEMPGVKGLWLGFGASVPFGLATSYDRAYPGRYFNLDTKLETVNFKPAVAYRLNDWISVGGGFNIMYAEAELIRAVDFGTILGAGAGTRDGEVKITGTDWAYAWDLGVMVTPMPALRVGATFKSAYALQLTGREEFTIPASAAAAAGNAAFQNTSARAAVNLPEVASLSAAYDMMGGDLTLLGDVTFTRWSSFQQLKITFGNKAQSASVTQQNWDNSYRLGVGAMYRPWTGHIARAGFAYDKSPVPDSYRNPGIPDNDRYWLSLGYSWSPTALVRIDAGLSHLIVPGSTVALRGGATGGGNLNGELEASVTIFSVGGSLQF